MNARRLDQRAAVRGALLVAVAAATLWGAALVTAEDDARLAIPDRQTREERRGRIGVLFDVSDARTTAQKQVLAKRLLETGKDTGKDTDGRFVLFNLAREMASDVGDMETALAAVDELHAQFEMDADAVRLASFVSATRASLPNDAKAKVVEFGLQYVNDLFLRDEYINAAKLLGMLQNVARSLRDRELQASIAARQQRGSALFKQYQAASSAIDTLENNPDANTAVGKFYCFGKGDWQRGLPLLARGSDAALKELAAKEMSPPTTSKAMSQLADAWWRAAGDSQQARAAMWYRRAVNDLTGLQKAVAQKRIAEAAELSADGGAPIGEQIARVEHEPDDKKPDRDMHKHGGPLADPTRPAADPTFVPTVDDNLPPGALLRLGSRRFMHPGGVRNLVVSDNGKYVVTFGNDSSVRLWNMVEATLVSELDLPSHSRASYDGGRLLLIADPLENGMTGQKFRIVDIATHAEKALFVHPKWSSSSDISSGGRLVVIGNIDKTASLVDPETGDVLDTLPVDPDGDARPDVSFSRADSITVRYGKERIKTFNLVMSKAFGEALATIDDQSHRFTTTSPTGDAIALMEGGVTTLWNARTGELAHTLTHPVRYSPESAAFSPDGRILAITLADHQTLLWDVATGRLVKQLKTGDYRVRNVDFTSDGRQILVTWGGRIFRYDLASGKELSYDPHRDLNLPVESIVITPDGRTVATSNGQGFVKVWSHAAGWRGETLSDEGTARYDPHPGPRFMMLINDGKNLLAASSWRHNSVNLWDLSTRRSVGRITGHRFPIHAVATHEPSGIVATTSRDKTMRIWDRGGRELRQAEVAANTIVMSPDGKLLALASSRGTGGDAANSVRLYGTDDASLVRTLAGHTERTLGLSFSPDGTQLVSSAADNTLRWWSVEDGRELKTIRTGDSPRAGHRDVRHSPDGKIIASAGYDGHVYLWDAETGEQLASLPGHDAEVHCVNWRSDGQQFISGAADASAVIWDLKKSLAQ